MKKQLLFFALISLLFSSIWCQAGGYYMQPGSFLYAANSSLEVFSVARDGKMAAAMTYFFDGGSMNARVTTFNPDSGATYDSKMVGFGPLSVKIVPSGQGYRVVALTSEGGPNTVTIFDVDQTGALVFRARTRLTDSGADYRSNLILSESGQLGYVAVYRDFTAGYDLICFSLQTGGVLGTLSSNYFASTIGINETGNNRTIVYTTVINGNVFLGVVDALNSGLMTLRGLVQLTFQEQIRTYTFPHAFSSNGGYIFVGNGVNSIHAVNLATLSIVGSYSNRYPFFQMKVVETATQRWIGAPSFDPLGYSNPPPGFFLIDATDPARMEGFSFAGFPVSHFAFSPAGDKLYFASDKAFRTVSVPQFTILQESDVPLSGHANHIEIFGPAGKVLAAWGVTDATMGVFPNADFGFSRFYPIASTSGKTISVFGNGFEIGSVQVFFGGTRRIPATISQVTPGRLEVVVPNSGTLSGNINGVITVKRDNEELTSNGLPFDSANPGDPFAKFPQFVLWGDANQDGTFGTADVTLARAFLLFQAIPNANQRFALDVHPENQTGSRGNGQLTTVDFTFLRAVSFGQTTF